MAGDILGVSISGLRVSQNALRVAGHNIANANTEGYSRQSVEINSVSGIQSGTGFLGSGAYVNNIERVVNEFVTGQVRQDTTLYSELNAFDQNVIKVNDLLSNESTGLTEGLQSFFSSVQTATDDPTSIATRQLMASEAGNLADRFNTLYSRLDTINDGVNESLEVALDNINSILKNIALLNDNIAESMGTSGGSFPNDLLDQRDQALKDLAALVPLKVSTQDASQVNVTIGDSIPVVLGVTATTLSLGQNEFNPLQSEIYLSSTNTTEPITEKFTSGEIGGLLNFQNTVIDSTLNQIGRIGLIVSENINQLQSQGMTLNNNFGTHLFTDINDANISQGRVFPSSNNTGTNVDISVSVTDTGQLTTSDYQFEIDNSSNVYTVTRLSDNVELASSIMPVNFPTSITFDGLSLDVTSGTFPSGDKFLIQPTRFGSQSFTALKVAPEDIALGSPVLTDSAIGNLGNAEISPGNVLSLVDANGTALPLLAQSGQMSPPLLVHYTSATTYDVLDNSDPANPVQLVPPIRNQTYVPGIANNLFTEDNGETMVVSNGSALGLPSNAKADLQPGGTPSFAVTDFSGTGNQFAFDVVVANTVGAANDGTFTVTINSAAITDTTSLLADINGDLAASRVRAYVTDAGGIGFLSLDDGAGDITLQNYNADPDTNLDNAPAGQANTLLGFTIETGSLTTVADANGISGTGTTANDYPAETFTFTTANPTTGGTTVQNITSVANASARSTASLFDNIDGVTANAFNYMELRDFDLSLNTPLQITLNSQDLVDYDGTAIDSAVPSPTLNNGEDFNDYLANAINSNTSLSSQGISAISAYDAVNSEFYIKINSTQGDDFSVQLEAIAGEQIEVNDGTNADMKLIAVGAGTTTDTVVGGRMDITLGDNITLTTTPTTSTILGDSSAANFARSTYLGIQASITGHAQAGDDFTIDFNTDAASDNRNGLSIANLQQQVSVGGLQNYDQSYNQLIESVGIQANTSKSNVLSAKNVLDQTISIRDSISGVNLDEEAANLIRFEQLYTANAQVVSVARDIFDRLMNSF